MKALHQAAKVVLSLALPMSLQLVSPMSRRLSMGLSLLATQHFVEVQLL